MLVVGGLYDAEDCYGAWHVYKALKEQSPSTNSHIVMGPWYHGEWASNDGTHLGNVQWGSNTSWWYQNNIEIPFFNYYLKGEGEKPGHTKRHDLLHRRKRVAAVRPVAARRYKRPTDLFATGWKPDLECPDAKEQFLANTSATRPTPSPIRRTFISGAPANTWMMTSASPPAAPTC